MSADVSRRDLLKLSLAGAAGVAALHAVGRTGRAVDYPKPVPEAAGLSVYFKHSLVLIRWDDQIACTYRALPAQKYPYFYPLTGPASGLPLTTESALPYPHHRGLWIGCDPLNGGNYWSDGPLEEGQISSGRLEVGEPAENAVSFTDVCEWHRVGGSPPATDRRRFTFTVQNENVRTLDVDYEWTAEEHIAIESAKHSFFALRCAPDIAPMYGGTLVNSEGGTGAAGTYGKPADWCGYYGKRTGRPAVVEGITICNHPDNFDMAGQCPWFTREYGHLSPSPLGFLKEPWRLEKGKSIRLRYRVVLHAGAPNDVGMDSIHAEWLKTT